MGNSQGKPVDLDGQVIRSESVRNIIRERRMLEHVNHPFICNLRYSFQDIEYMYLVVDLMTGGDLRFHISRKTFTEEAVRFWIAELGCALRYVHGQGIIHRDVKPDNVLLDADGHVHLTDFNVATDVVPGRLIASRSGTLAYLGPEVYAGKGSTWESFTQHEFFQAIDFVALEQKFLEPIFVPSSEKTNFDATYDLEELLLEEAPLEARARRQKPRERLKEDATDKEIREDELYRMIESEFKNFDYTVAALRKLGIDSPGNSHPDGMRTCPASTSNPSQGMALTTDATVYVPTSKENSHTRSYTRSQTQNSSHSPPTTYQQHIDASQHMPGSSAQSTRSASGSFSKSGSRPPPVVSNNEIMRKNLAGRRIQSSTGGVQVTLDGHGSWSTLARQDATLPADAGGHEKDKENGGAKKAHAK
ncbi:Serine/threonine-protein kinase 32C [Ceratocystis platani]|uniref:Serine/threonine-protein kinase 32C n=1 Tax=Ceratocystis fimbriata f. sp. platani TaxID=88771 RepID=A0A0F8B8W5_CERFI|nr:Serine/threonine-protein kinase 32C [Ceratocystis platani]